MGKYNRPTKPKKATITPRGIVAQEPINKGDAVIATQEEVKSMNIYQKVQLIRSAIADADIQRTSKNADKGFTYLELPDYLPLINKLGAEHGIMTHFNMTGDEATLKIINTEKPDEVLEWTLPVKGYEMPDAQAIQILKGTTTYMRRALFEVAFEISVRDTVDAQGSKTPTRPEDDLTQEQVDKLRATKDLEELAHVAQEIKNAPGFNKEAALLKHYTVKKGELEQ